MKNLLITLALAGAAATAGANFLSGNDLYEQMNGSHQFDQARAIGYVMGAYDGLLGVGGIVCPPRRATVGQVFDIVNKHMEMYPSLRYLPAHAQNPAHAA